LLTNHRPIVRGDDEGIWRRLRVVPFDVVIPAAERDTGLPDRLRGELEAVLAWLVGGYWDWQARGLAEPEQVVAATTQHRAESDSLGRFLDQRCLLGEHYHVGSSELFAAWRAWCAEEGA